MFFIIFVFFFTFLVFKPYYSVWCFCVESPSFLIMLLNVVIVSGFVVLWWISIIVITSIRLFAHFTSAPFRTQSFHIWIFRVGCLQVFASSDPLSSEIFCCDGTTDHFKCFFYDLLIVSCKECCYVTPLWHLTKVIITLELFHISSCGKGILWWCFMQYSKQKCIGQKPHFTAIAATIFWVFWLFVQ